MNEQILREALEKIASNWDEGQTLSGTMCAEIARAALSEGKQEAPVDEELQEAFARFVSKELSGSAISSGISIIDAATLAFSAGANWLASQGRPIGLPPIDTDAEMNRHYIPVHPDWEIQTKGKGSSFRIANRKTHDRWLVTDTYLHEMLEEMARDIHAALSVAAPQSPSGWISRLKDELMLSPAKSNFTLSRDELIEIFGGHSKLLNDYTTQPSAKGDSNG